ncbi:unnamed protein product [Sphagnum jensenii]|uniref:Uncharacterized protein n=2 Tax=Sphagnum jensenii TaxID=128206 RepID=A0ABP0V622_9BRYO
MRAIVRTHRDFYVIKVHDLEGSCHAVPGGPLHEWASISLLEKINERYPDFKHKKTGETLWIEDRGNATCVAAEMAVMALGRVQLNIFAWNQKLTKDVEDGQPEKAMQLFQQMQQEGMSPEKFTFV